MKKINYLKKAGLISLLVGTLNISALASSPDKTNSVKDTNQFYSFPLNYISIDDKVRDLYFSPQIKELEKEKLANIEIPYDPRKLDSLRLKKIQDSCDLASNTEKVEQYIPLTKWYEIIQKKDSLIQEKYINSKFIESVIIVESKENPRARSYAGARGLMQLMPQTWHSMEKKYSFYNNAYKPEKNIEVGIKYLNWLGSFIEENNPDWECLNEEQRISLIAAAYNGGPTRLKNNNWDIQKMPFETRNYVTKILDNYYSNRELAEK